MIELQQRLMAFVGRAADAIPDQDDAESMIDRPYGRGRHADVGFRAGHDQRVCLAGTKMVQQSRAEEGSHTTSCRSRSQAGPARRRVGMSSREANVEAVARCLRPCFVIGAPRSRQVLRRAVA